MGEAKEIWSAPITPRTGNSLLGTPMVSSPPVSCPPSQLHSPSLTRSPLLQSENGDVIHPKSKTPKTPRTPRTPRMSLTPRFITPLGSPMRKALRLTKLDPQDAWLPITESRNGNKYYAAFHTLCSGIGIQALVLPVAFTILGWTWGIISLTIAFIWQLYTLWLLVHLHESVEHGVRYSRYLQLCFASFGERLGKLLALFPIMYLSAGTCTTLIIIGGSTARTFYQVVCGHSCTAKPMTTVEWYLVFTCAAVVLSQLPNLNSIAGISLIGAITAVGYCTIIWIVSVAKGALPGVNYNPATMPSSEKHPSHVPMWKGVKASYTLIAACIFPLAIGGYWAYGQLIPANGGMLTALYAFHSQDVSRFVLGLTSFFVVVNGVAIPFLSSLAGLIGGVALPVTLAYPCFMWLKATMPSSEKHPSYGVKASYTLIVACIFPLAIGGYWAYGPTGVAIPFLSSLAGLIGEVALPVTLAYPCFMWLK
ncbi:hypothetical protein TSUD_235120, partial [Trifolium subterraneum]